MDTESFLSIKEKSEGLYKEKGSKFLSFAHPIESEDQFKEILHAYKKEYSTARHHCYAFKIGNMQALYRYSDDGEPSGTAGKPIYGQILSKNVTNICIIVVRYFGGTLLGAGGLVSAYKAAASNALENAVIIEHTIKQVYRITYTYEQTSLVMSLLNKFDIDQLKSEYDTNCRMDIAVNKSQVDNLLANFNEQLININFLREE
jgi:uncharacterized YigZ family protein